jgi:hypothetical protein
VAEPGVEPPAALRGFMGSPEKVLDHPTPTPVSAFPMSSSHACAFMSPGLGRQHLSGKKKQFAPSGAARAESGALSSWPAQGQHQGQSKGGA